MYATFNANPKNRFSQAHPIEVVVDSKMRVRLQLHEARALLKSLAEALNEAIEADEAANPKAPVTLDWRIEGTGGGCDALWADWGNDCYAMITERDDPSAPESEYDECGLGLYNADGEPLHWSVCENTAAAKQYAAELVEGFLNGGRF
jgi:hypothetical protein